MIHTGLSKPWILDKYVAIYRKLYYISCVEKRGYFIIILVYAEHLISKYFVIEPFKTPGICKPLKLFQHVVSCRLNRFVMIFFRR